MIYSLLLTDLGEKYKAEYICQAHHYSLSNPEVISQTHNHFQRAINATSLNDEPERLEQHSMLPAGAGKRLENRNKYKAFKAYLSTSQSNWNEKNSHYCCQNYGLGCLRSSNNIKIRVDKKTHSLIRGWSYDPDKAHKPTVVYFQLDNKVIGKTLSNMPRAGVNRAFRISGNHGFKWIVPTKYRDSYDKIEVFVRDLTTGTKTMAN